MEALCSSPEEEMAVPQEQISTSDNIVTICDEELPNVVVGQDRFVFDFFCPVFIVIIWISSSFISQT